MSELRANPWLLLHLMEGADSGGYQRMTLDPTGALLVDEEDGVGVFSLAPEHAYYLAAQLTKWADAQEMEDNS